MVNYLPALLNYIKYTYFLRIRKLCLLRVANLLKVGNPGLWRYLYQADDPVLFSTTAFHFFIPDAETVVANGGVDEHVAIDFGGIKYIGYGLAFNSIKEPLFFLVSVNWR